MTMFPQSLFLDRETLNHRVVADTSCWKTPRKTATQAGLTKHHSSASFIRVACQTVGIVCFRRRKSPSKSRPLPPVQRKPRRRRLRHLDWSHCVRRGGSGGDTVTRSWWKQWLESDQRRWRLFLHRVSFRTLFPGWGHFPLSPSCFSENVTLKTPNHPLDKHLIRQQLNASRLVIQTTCWLLV